MLVVGNDTAKYCPTDKNYRYVIDRQQVRRYWCRAYQKVGDNVTLTGEYNEGGSKLWNLTRYTLLHNNDCDKSSLFINRTSDIVHSYSVSLALPNSRALAMG